MLQGADAARNQTADQPVAHQGLKKLILKLRWAGLDQDAENLCHKLAPQYCVPPEPAETD